MTSVVLVKGLATFLICYTKVLNVPGPESEPHAPCRKSVQTTSLWLLNKLLATMASYNKITMDTVTTKPPGTIIDFNIWNLILVLTAMFALMLQIISI